MRTTAKQPAQLNKKETKQPWRIYGNVHYESCFHCHWGNALTKEVKLVMNCPTCTLFSLEIQPCESSRWIYIECSYLHWFSSYLDSVSPLGSWVLLFNSCEIVTQIFCSVLLLKVEWLYLPTCQLISGYWMVMTVTGCNPTSQLEISFFWFLLAPFMWGNSRKQRSGVWLG